MSRPWTRNAPIHISNPFSQQAKIPLLHELTMDQLWDMAEAEKNRKQGRGSRI
jgi:hypothetical protein